MKSGRLKKIFPFSQILARLAIIAVEGKVESSEMSVVSKDAILEGQSFQPKIGKEKAKTYAGCGDGRRNKVGGNSNAQACREACYPTQDQWVLCCNRQMSSKPQ